jgi:hypothetical protein
MFISFHSCCELYTGLTAEPILSLDGGFDVYFAKEVLFEGGKTRGNLGVNFTAKIEKISPHCTCMTMLNNFRTIRNKWEISTKGKTKAAMRN